MQAINARFPPDSELLHSPKVLLQVLAKGRGFKHPQDNVYTFSEIKPVKVVTHIPNVPKPWIPATGPDGQLLKLPGGGRLLRDHSAEAELEPISC